MRKILLAILLTGMLFTACSKDDNKPADKDSIEYFTANLNADLKYDDMVNLFGPPDGDAGSGIHIYFYILNDGTKIHIGYVDKILYARHVSASGQVLHTFV
ncbi:MAG TPA: hypothetical protein VF008_11110 [Niastella sp.]